MEIAVGVLSGMVDALPGKLGELLQQEYTLLSGVRGDVSFLQSELGTMHAALLRCESVDDPDFQTRTWVGMVRELAYDIEDWVDLFAHRVDAGSHDANGAGGSSSSSSRFFGLVRCCVEKLTTLPSRHVIANELQDLKARVLVLSEQRKRYRIEAPAGPSGARCAASIDPRLAVRYADTTSLVGLDAPMEEVANMVMDAGNKTELKVVSIVGMAGSGKTTLAWCVHRRLERQKCFDCRAFVSVGQKPDIAGKTLKGILWQVGDGYGGGEDIGQLIGRLREKLQDKRYLIVIDDLWSITEWSTIKCCFPDNNLGSRIMITTRNDALGKECSSHLSECIYKCGLLSDADSRNLFSKKVFGNGDVCPQHLEDVFAKIMRRCGDLPLAVASVAAVLKDQSSKDEWERFGSNLLSTSHLDGVKRVLNLSYNDLPPHLKPCLLYLSIFPADYEIDIERLVRQWIAEGIIGQARRESREETARCYLSELISRNVVQPLHLKRAGTPRSCTVHPVIHDFIVIKSMEENFVTLVDGLNKNASPNRSTVRRLSLHNSSKQDQVVAQNDGMNRARSVTVYGHHASGVPRLTDLSVLRVLDLESCEGSVCLDGLCMLVLLRYLSLRGTDVSELPAQIGDLRCLETLDVRSTKVKELPPSIVRLDRLIHLLVGNAKLPCGIGKMKSLLTLSCADVGKSSECAIQELSEICNLRELKLFCDATQMSGDEKRITFPSDGFRNLKQLCIHCGLPSVTFETGALPKVEVLELKFEKGLSEESSGVSGMERLPSLKHVLIEFSQHDAGAVATIAAVRTAAETVHPNRPDFTVEVDGENN